MTISKDKIVSVIYELKTNSSEEIIEKAVAETPLTFLCGAGQMLEKFENNLMGLAVGASFDFELKCDDAYGQASEEAIVDLPKNIFEVDGAVDTDVIKEGNAVPMQDNTGRKMNGIVLEVAADTVKMDFNHPLAGDDLFFKGEVIEVRDASEQELKQASGHEDCDGGSCGSGCSC